MQRTEMTIGTAAGVLLLACTFALIQVNGRKAGSFIGGHGDPDRSLVSVAAQHQQPGWRETAVHMRLQDDLDRPQDGWCLDVVGSGPHIRFDMPLIAHNIKPGLFADEAVEFTENGQIRFPAYPGYCVTVMGLNEFALPGAALMLKKCGEDIPFLNASKFQTFELLDNGMVQLKGTDLCITVGDESERTFDPTHRWRTLYMERREDCDPARSTWKFVRP